MLTKKLYFLRPAGQRSPIKIGCSYWPERRVETLMAWSPLPLEIITSCAGSQEIERRLHGIFAGDHSHSEWFHASAALLALIEKVAAGTPIAELVDLRARVLPFRTRKGLMSPERRRYRSYAARVRIGFNSLPGEWSTGRRHEPADVAAIMERWRGFGAKGVVEPTAAEIDRLEHVLADPAAHAVTLREHQQAPAPQTSEAA